MKIQILYYYIMNIVKNNNCFLGVIIFLILLSGIIVQNDKIVELENRMIVLNAAINNSFNEFVGYLERSARVSFNGIVDYRFPVKNVLIYRYSDDMCDECIRQDLQELYKFQMFAGKQNLMILPSYEDRELRSFAQSGFLKDFNYKNISDSILLFPNNVESGTFKRYIAYVDSCGKIESIFFPEKFKQSMTQYYLQGILDKFQKSK